MYKILVVDNEEGVRYSLKKLLHEPEYQVIGVRDGQTALTKLRQLIPSMVIVDIQLPGMSGLELLQRIKQRLPDTPVVVFTDHGSNDRIISAIKYGAHDYVEKPFDIPKLRAIINEALQNGHDQNPEPGAHPYENTYGSADADPIVGGSPVMREVCKMIGRVAANDVNVLLTGESGTGKELVAHAIHRHSQRAGKVFLAVNCAAIPETLLESELFGYEKGAFTGASKRKIGKFEQAAGGTLFLDEIGDMNLSTQVKLLRVLQEGSFEHLGGDTTIQADVRVIAATNQNLEQLIEQQRFREDLYYRIKVITISLPPLRAHMEDLPDLVNYFMAKHSFHLKKHKIALSPETMQLLQRYDWPGNIRELENVLQRALLLCQNGVITPEIIAPDLHSKESCSTLPETDRLAPFLANDLESYRGKIYNMVISEVEKDLIIRALRESHGNKTRAAKFLGISKVMLHDRIHKFGIEMAIVFNKNANSDSVN